MALAAPDTEGNDVEVLEWYRVVESKPNFVSSLTEVLIAAEEGCVDLVEDQEHNQEFELVVATKMVRWSKEMSHNRLER
jgi:hypothetical protein